MDTLHSKSGEFVAELEKLNSVAEQAIALNLVQQIMNGILSTYTLARFTVKAFVVEDCRASNGKKKTLDQVAQVLKFLVKPKSEVNNEEVLRGDGDNNDENNEEGLKGDADNNDENVNNSDELNSTSIKDEISDALAAFAAESFQDAAAQENLAQEAQSELEEELEEDERTSDKDEDYEMSEENVEDDDYKPSAKTRKDLRGAKRRKQGFKVRIRQTRKSAKIHKVSEDLSDGESIKDAQNVKPKRTRKKRKVDSKRDSSVTEKKGRLSEEVVKCATDIHCFICTDNSVTYPTEDEFFDHCAKEHVEHSATDKEVLPCAKCDKSFRVSAVKGAKSNMRTPVYTLLNHLVDKHRTMRPDWAPVYKCKNCTHTTLVRSFLPHHEKTCGQIVPTVTCEFCGMMLKKNSLYLHIKRCSNPASKVAKYKCDECGKMYLTQAILDIHVKRMHRKEASHLCTQCTQTFFAKVDLERHMFVHHGVNISRMSIASCPVCNFQTLEGSLMRKHMKNHDIGAHPCEFCGRIFGTMNRLRMHRLTHTAERKHKCPHCTYTAIRSFHLQRHIAVRHLGSPFKCARCTFSTTSTHNLRRHMTKSHKYDELTAIEETSNIPTNSVTEELLTVAMETLKQPSGDNEVKAQVPIAPNNSALDDQLPLRASEPKEVPNLSVQQLVAASGAGNISDNRLQQQQSASVLPQQQQQQQQQQRLQQQQQQQQQQLVTMATTTDQTAAPSYIQPLFTASFGMPYHMSVAAPVAMPTASSTEHASFLRHVLEQKMAASAPSNIQQQQQQQLDPNNMYNVHYNVEQQQQQQQQQSAVLHDQQQQQNYVPQQ